MQLSTQFRKSLFVALVLLGASVAAFGQCTVPPCQNQDKQIMGSRWQASGDDTGTANNYAITTVASLGPGLRDYSVIIFKAAHDNTGASTLAVDGLSPIAIKKGDPSGPIALTGGEIIHGLIYTVKYHSSCTCFQLESGTGSSSGLGTTIHTCNFTFGDPGALSPVLANDNDGQRQCGNNFGADATIMAVSVYVDAGATTFTPILTGGSGTSILTGAITGSAGTWVSGTVNGSPVIHSFSSDAATCSSTPCTIDANITTADGTTKYAVLQVVVTSSGGTAATTVGTGGAANHQLLFDDAGLVNGISNGTSGYVLTSNGTSSTPSFQAAPGVSGSAGGDLSGTYPNPTVAKINGNSVPSGAASHQVLVATGASTFSLKTVPDCTDTGGNHLNYTQSTDAFSCGTSGSGGGGSVTTTGSPASGNLTKFSGATSITNGNLSGDVTTSGTLAATVVKVNGGSIPASATALASNSSNQIIAATLQGNGSKVQLSTGSTTTGNCGKFDSNGNIIDAGITCSGGTGGGTSPCGVVTAPPTTGWSYDVAGGSTADTTNPSGIALTNTSYASGTRFYYRTAPSTPYTITACLYATLNTGDVAINFGFRNSVSGKYVFFHMTLSTLFVFKFNSSNSPSASYSSQVNPTLFQGPLLLQISDDGTNLIFRYQYFGMGSWVTFLTKSRTDFMAAPDQVGFGSYDNGGAMVVNLVSWAATSP